MFLYFLPAMRIVYVVLITVKQAGSFEDATFQEIVALLCVLYIHKPEAPLVNVWVP